MSDTNKIFQLIDFSPVGIKVNNYPVKYCAVCRGLLTDPCGSCVEKNINACDVGEKNEFYFHKHCQQLLTK
ncbi:hypothetical protein [Acanthamoeba castellanii mimivirus]|uniref:Uncharacterized protein n=3 Tax=Mimivirus TaxID=315393 RepID=A0A0G2Y6G3_MIMIV|nr:hypothetical protein MIMI_gp0639 [Acanthamoeba polyphaga mimivirus]AEQ60794.1 hypothetical protein [Acanthamoeba castellanii mamavirus]AHA45250.1 hypothetical protein HIRU_S344 [Hirudovirus strain Sangsue]AHJ40235.1 hypothetical protein [Samba virus]BAV61710.1 hypothetical protein [Acanthamoeba castellanii mimivirus]ADO18727.1 hypothetical protein [Acanthamoeba polyphaga mimivirus]